MSAIARGVASAGDYQQAARRRQMARDQKGARVAREAGHEARAQAPEKRADRGLTTRERSERARELVARRAEARQAKATAPARTPARTPAPAPAPAAAARPTLREQAATHRQAVKGGSDWARANRLAARSLKAAKSAKGKAARAEKAGNLARAVEQRRRQLAATERANRLLARNAPVDGRNVIDVTESSAAAARALAAPKAAPKPAAPVAARAPAKAPDAGPVPRPASGRGAPARLERAAAVRVERAFARTPGAGRNLVTLEDLRRNLGGDRARQDLLIRRARIRDAFTADSYEGRHGPLTPGQDAAAIREAGSKLVFLARKSTDGEMPKGPGRGTQGEGPGAGQRPRPEGARPGDARAGRGGPGAGGAAPRAA